MSPADLLVWTVVLAYGWMAGLLVYLALPETLEIKLQFTWPPIKLGRRRRSTWLEVWNA